MIIGGLIFAAFLLGAIIAAAALRPRHDPSERARDRDYSKYPAGQGADNASSIIAVAEEIQRGRKEANAAEADKRYREILTVGGILIYTVITACIAVISFYQAQIFKETEKRQLRSYVGIGTLEVQCCRKTTDPPNTPLDTIRLPIDNDGQTPAEYLYSIMTLLQFSNEEVFPDDFQCANGTLLDEREKHVAVINPKKNLGSPFGISDDTRTLITEAQEKKFWLVFCGNVIYRDIFKDAYSLAFCYQFHNPHVRAEISFCPGGNQETSISAVTLPAARARERRPPVFVPEVPRFNLGR